MNYDDFIEVTGQRLGADGTNELMERAETICMWERTRIELANQPALVVKKIQYSAALEEERLLRSRLAQMVPAFDLKSRRRKIAACWIVASILVMAGFILSLLTLEPFRLGLKGALYCIGIAVIVPFLVEQTLGLFASKTLRQILTATSCLAALVSMVMLATIRGNLLAEQVRHPSASVVIEGEEPEKLTSAGTFYEDTVSLLQLVMALLAFAMEIGSGIAIYEAERLAAMQDGEYNTVSVDLRQARTRLALLAGEICFLQNEAAVFVAHFWRNFYWSILKGTAKNAAKRLIFPVLILLLFFPVAVFAQAPVDLVVAVDLTKSVDRAGPDGQTEFAKNISAVTRLLRRLPAGSRLAIVGITADSFSQPYILLQAQLNSDPGFFGEKLNSGREAIAHAWLAKSRLLAPTFVRSDVLGTLFLAGAVFAEHPNDRRKVLVLYSDMLQATPQLNLESPSVRSPSEVMVKVNQNDLQGDMRNIEVYVVGADAIGQTVSQWQRIREFWESYFRKSNATLVCYSAFRDFAVFH